MKGEPGRGVLAIRLPRAQRHSWSVILAVRTFARSPCLPGIADCYARLEPGRPCRHCRDRGSRRYRRHRRAHAHPESAPPSGLSPTRSKRSRLGWTFCGTACVRSPTSIRTSARSGTTSWLERSGSSGPSAATPRILMLMAGTLTVLLTYALGRVLHGRRVGLLASTLLATSAMHTAVNSHIAWSNCVTPLFTTAWPVLARALRDVGRACWRRPGLLFGLSVPHAPHGGARTGGRRSGRAGAASEAGSRARGPIWQGFSRWPATQT